jgi:MraZ protein
VSKSRFLAQFVADWGKLGQIRSTHRPLEHSLIFAGEYEHRIDPQGRVAIPARFKQAFLEGIVLGRAYDNCVVVYTPEEWERAASDIAQQPATSANARKLARLTFSGAYVGSLDRSGRVVIPQQLREYAGLGDDVVIVGTGRFMEIWSVDAWEHERRSLDTDAADIAESAPQVSNAPQPTPIILQQIDSESDR